MRPPLVSIGLPVANEARHIDAALASLRAQDHASLEIIVCDNASTDETMAICRRHAAEDPRIRLEPLAEAVTVTANFRRAVDLARGDYFMWASGHDLWDPGLVRECVAALEADPSSCLAYGSAEWIDGTGAPMRRRSGWTDTHGLAPAARFFTVFWGNMHPAVGVIRTPLLRECGPLAAMVGADLLLLCALALRGNFAHVPGAHWSRRELRAERTYAEKVKRYVSSDFGVTRSWLGRRFPLLSLPLALLGLVWRTPLPLADRLCTIAVLLPSLALRYRVGRRPAES
jgi:glycosyltransferase involved in cell wall biosynthesis